MSGLVLQVRWAPLGADGFQCDDWTDWAMADQAPRGMKTFLGDRPHLVAVDIDYATHAEQFRLLAHGFRRGIPVPPAQVDAPTPAALDARTRWFSSAPGTPDGMKPWGPWLGADPHEDAMDLMANGARLLTAYGRNGHFQFRPTQPPTTQD